ncbi:hypothetical protein RHSIM_Rhsim11G0176300 [Rhododendron simsii]|uniref:Uncharacterized protein n=1 Tax=Rhododendron simsii TaxID=118357 RepID=A0A834L8P3_RHOSS|nr:hypothetical protein RHSIM_Rhsim11G0176300 [Rhododendron simsii]
MVLGGQYRVIFIKAFGAGYDTSQIPHDSPFHKTGFCVAAAAALNVEDYAGEEAEENGEKNDEDYAGVEAEGNGEKSDEGDKVVDGKATVEIGEIDVEGRSVIP